MQEYCSSIENKINQVIVSSHIKSSWIAGSVTIAVNIGQDSETAVAHNLLESEPSET